MHKNLIDITNKTFNNLKIIRFHHTKNRQSFWLCDCACGNKTIAESWKIRTGYTKSCGCIKGKQYQHGYSRRINGIIICPEYKIWLSMKNRCYNKKDKPYKDYGGRNIFVCNRWINSFENFYSDMGKRPSTKHTIERINNNKGYSPDNCKWASMYEQNNNSRKNHNITINGIKKSVSQWLRFYNFPRTTFYRKLKQGQSPQSILSNVKHFT